MDQSQNSGECEPTRVMLWSIPRSLSTVVTKCISFIDGMEVWFEPYFICQENLRVRNPDYLPDNPKMASYRQTLAEFYSKLDCSTGTLGPRDNLYDEEKFTYLWVKSQLEKSRSKYILVKEMCHAIDGVPLTEYLPDVPFQETFLIRHPKKVFASFKRAGNIELGRNVSNIDDTDIIHDLPVYHPDRFYKELYEKWQTVKNTTGRQPVVIEADDLLANPELILRKYFESVGFPWDKTLLSWDPSPEMSTRWHSSYMYMKTASQSVWLKNAVSSSCFLKQDKTKQDTQSEEKLSRDVEICVNASMPYYNEMRQHCI